MFFYAVQALPFLMRGHHHPSAGDHGVLRSHACAHLSEEESREDSWLVEEAGFEPAYAKRTDLQSVSFNHSDTPPSQLARYDDWAIRCQQKQRLFRRYNAIIMNFLGPQQVQPRGARGNPAP